MAEMRCSKIEEKSRNRKRKRKIRTVYGFQYYAIFVWRKEGHTVFRLSFSSPLCTGGWVLYKRDDHRWEKKGKGGKYIPRYVGSVSKIYKNRLPWNQSEDPTGYSRAEFNVWLYGVPVLYLPSFEDYRGVLYNHITYITYNIRYTNIVD